MTFNVKDHGDSLEKEFSTFIQTEFPTYEAVWKLYIGNRGNDNKALITGYSSNRDEMRQKFSEHTYTIFQSLISIRRLIINEAFKKGEIKDVSHNLDLQDSIVLFFAYLGRIKDNLQDAASCLLNCNSDEIGSKFGDFYSKRNIVLHGKMLPIAYRPNGDIIIPALGENTDRLKWHDKTGVWDSITFLNLVNLAEYTNSIYIELLSKLSHAFGIFKSKIEDELNKNNLEISFENKHYPEAYASGSTSATSAGVDVYKLGNIKPKNL